LSYHQFGFTSAQHSNSKAVALDGFLARVYEQFLDEERLDKDGIEKRISKLQAEVQLEKQKRNDAKSDLASLKSEKGNIDKEIQSLELEKIELKNEGVETKGTIPFVIGSFITLLLTLYLFVFYSSSGYSAFYGIKNGTLGFINPTVFTDAINKGSGVIALIILFPVIFLGLGFLIHDALDTNRKLTELNKPGKYGTIVSLLFVTLIADAFIGYKIAEGIHANLFNAGLTDEVWRFSMIINDINFYLVLILGFVVYVIWGFLLHYVLSHDYLQPESEKVNQLVENINNVISDKKIELNEILRKINKIDSDILNIDDKIIEKEDSIIGYQNGVLPVNIAALRGSVGSFMGGWQAYTTNKFDPEVAHLLIEESVNTCETWLANKIQSLTTDK
jgi:DNA repair exonuclease SbcCD ATPase subunit